MIRMENGATNYQDERDPLVPSTTVRPLAIKRNWKSRLFHGMTPCWCGLPMPGLEWCRVFCTRHGPLNMTVSGGKKEHESLASWPAENVKFNGFYHQIYACCKHHLSVLNPKKTTNLKLCSQS